MSVGHGGVASRSPRARLRVSPGGAQGVQEGLLRVHGCRRGTSEAAAGRGSRLREPTWRPSTSTLDFVSLDNDLFCHDASSSEKHPQRFFQDSAVNLLKRFGHQLQSDTKKKGKEIIFL